MCRPTEGTPLLLTQHTDPLLLRKMREMTLLVHLISVKARGTISWSVGTSWGEPRRAEETLWSCGIGRR